MNSVTMFKKFIGFFLLFTFSIWANSEVIPNAKVEKKWNEEKVFQSINNKDINELEAFIAVATTEQLNKSIKINDSQKASFLGTLIHFIKDKSKLKVLVKQALDKGASIKGVEEDSFSPLKELLKKKKIEILKLFLDNGLFVDTLVEVQDRSYAKQKLPLFYYVLQHHSEFSEEFLSYNPSVTYPKHQIIDGSYLAMYLETDKELSVKVVKYLLDKKEKITDKIYHTFLDQKSIYSSKSKPKVYKQRLEIFNILFDKVDNPLLKGDTSRVELLATVRGDKTTLDKLFEKGLKPNDTGHFNMTHFEGSVDIGDLELFKRLLAEGGKLFEASTKGETKGETVFYQVAYTDKKILAWLFKNKKEVFENVALEDVEKIALKVIRRYYELPESIIFLINNVPNNEKLLTKLLKKSMESRDTIAKQLMFLREGLLSTYIDFSVLSLKEMEKHIEDVKETKHYKPLLNVIFIGVLFDTNNINDFLLAEEKLKLLEKHNFSIDGFLNKTRVYISMYMKNIITTNQKLKLVWLLMQGLRVEPANQNYYVDSNYMRGLIDRASMGVKTLSFKPRTQTEFEGLNQEVFHKLRTNSWYKKHIERFRWEELSIQDNNLSGKVTELSPEIKAFQSELEKLTFNYKLDEAFDYSLDEAKVLIEKQNDLSALNNSELMSKILLKLLVRQKIEHLNLMLEKNLDLPTVTKKSKNLLKLMHKKRRWKSLRFLMTKGGFPLDRVLWMKKHPYDGRPLLSVISKNDVESLKWAIQNKISIKEKYYEDISPLIQAVKGENFEMVKLLMKDGANPHYKTLKGISAISLSQVSKKEEIKAYFSSYITASTFTVFMLNRAIKKKNLKEVKSIMESGIDANREDKVYHRGSPLEVAIKVADLEILEYLLKHGVDVNRPIGGHKRHVLSAMQYANNAQDQIRLALKYGAFHRAKNDDFSLLESVFSSQRNPEIRDIFIEHNVSLTNSVNEGGQLVIHALLREQGEKKWSQFIVDKMLKQGHIKALSSADASGNTPLHYAVATKKFMIVKNLLSLGVNTKAMNKKGVQAISYASTKELLTLLEPHSDHEPSISDSYCMVYVENKFDKSKISYCQTTADYYAVTKNHSQAIWYYFLANDLESIKKYTQDMSWMKKCDCNCNYPDYYAYFHIANAYLLSDDRKNAKKYYEVLAEFMKGSPSKDWMIEPFKVLEGLHPGYGDKAKKLFKEVWKEKYTEEYNAPHI